MKAGEIPTSQPINTNSQALPRFSAFHGSFSGFPLSHCSNVQLWARSTLESWTIVLALSIDFDTPLRSDGLLGYKEIFLVWVERDISLGGLIESFGFVSGFEPWTTSLLDERRWVHSQCRLLVVESHSPGKLTLWSGFRAGIFQVDHTIEYFGYL